MPKDPSFIYDGQMIKQNFSWKDFKIMPDYAPKI